MSKVKCKYCSKKIEDNLKKCPKCKKYLGDKSVIIKTIMYFGWVILQSIICYLLYAFGKESFYSEHLNDLLILVILILVLLFNSIIVVINIYKNKKKSGLLVLAALSVVFFIVYSLIYSFNVVKAYIYENSNELLMLNETYDFSSSKTIKEEIEKVFEKDSTDTFSRDIIISNLYTDGEISNLYIDDSYGNFKLKFYVDFDDFKIKDVYSIFGDSKLYLVKDGKKTDNFEFYYAMNILKNVLGEDINGLARIDSAIEEEIGKNFSVSANAMFNYEELKYNERNNTFLLTGDIYNMDYYGGMEDKSFNVIFKNNCTSSNRRVWYYGDSSFDYVNWDVNM